MAKFIINGGSELNGKIEISGSKNAALPIIAATLLTEKKVTLLSVPNLSDIHNMLNLLRSAGKDFTFSNGKLTIFESKKCIDLLSDDLIFNTIRASCLVLGPMLGMHGKVSIKNPGGCAIGSRPIDLHLMALEKMGANFTMHDNVITGTVKHLQGTTIEFPKISVGATQNALMASVLADGETIIIRNSAVEPEVTDLANFLVTIGAKIDGIGTRELKIIGVKELKGCEYKIIPDRIEAATYLILLAAIGGQVVLENVNCSDLANVIEKIKETKAISIECNNDSIIAKKINEISPVDISTESYPGFPTDLQPQFMVLMCLANGTSIIEENIFENRFMHVPELKKFGADIRFLNDKSVVINGRRYLTRAIVKGTDLRATAALMIAGFSSPGVSIINNARQISRGYENIQFKLKNCQLNVNFT